MTRYDSRSGPPMLTVLGLLLMVSVASGCQSPAWQDDPEPAALLDGQLLFGSTIAPAPGDASALLATDAAMRAFVAAWVHPDGSRQLRTRQLLQGMLTEGLLNLDYSLQNTGTALETFQRRSGNCLSFTLLFAALAAEAEIDARFQMVDVPPDWTSGDDLVVLNRHINMRIPRASQGSGRREDLVVDFNLADLHSTLDTRLVDTSYALALYHTNLAVEALRSDAPRAAFAHLKTALLEQPQLAAAWVNLGLLYARQSRTEAAVAAYHQALRHDPGQPSALNNLVSLYQRLGEDELAQRYLAQVYRYREQNPYWHAYLGRTALDAGQLDEALTASRRALRLRDDDPSLHALLAAVLYRKGALNAAADSLATAARLEDEQGRGGRMAAKLDALRREQARLGVRGSPQG